jgi:hypothetical protein
VIYKNCYIFLCVTYIQSVPGGHFNFLGDHSIGHSKQKCVYVHMSYSERFRDKAISLYSSKIVNKKEIFRTVSITVIYCSNDKFGTVYLV